MTDLLLVAVSDAFLDVGVVLALVAVLVGLVGPRCAGVGDLLRRRPSLGPVLGAVLGVTPGCSGALVVTPLFARGHVSLGTLVATLTATTGDSAWALWAGAPRTAAAVHAVVFALGVVLGCGIDALRARRPRLLASCDPVPPRQVLATGGAAGTTATAPATTRPGATSLLVRTGLAAVRDDVVAARAEIAARCPRRQWPPSLRPAALLGVLALFWTTAGAGTAAAVTGLASTTPPGPELTWQRWVGLLGFLACVGVLLRRRALGGSVLPGPSGAPASGRGRLRSNLEGAAGQAASVVLWVAGAYALLAAGQAVAGPAAESLRLTGLTSVVAGTVVGALPGCGFQIAWVGLYLDGAVDLPGLLADAIAQDGDALLPLVVMARRSALAVTALTSAPALLVGGAVAVLWT